ncbi:sensor histidine kinase [Paenibacillus sp. HN-1]|uniref:sensor histidine kinase n=1 Tax=Paenibacillus TaxID=44249 RepID=UPI001CA847CA|nr:MULTISPECIES: sensor histidine kinase [Paenibacillus]MBY9077552.1 sensor histidine kinase [Paenibacillus sp. CGMCC 1.18879]MBY9087823.1 sensor histidine kinase [Paenibacillus sinensis]
MNKPLSFLRYGLIAVPAFLFMYIGDYTDYGLFTLHLLILLLIATMGSKLPERFVPAAAAAEMLYSVWLCSRYGSLMVFPSLSSLLVYSRMRFRPLYLLLGAAHLAALNAVFLHADPLERAWINLGFLTSALLCLQLAAASRGQEEMMMLYDELRRKHFELDEARSRLLQFTAQVETAAQSEERVRIGRQIHDDIGHRLIRVKMMMEAALHTFPSAPEAGLSMMYQVRDQLAEAMDELRNAVRRIGREPRLEGAYALDLLLEVTGRDTGIRTSYDVEGTPYPLYPSQQVVLYKNAKEAITNGLRHGHATEVGIRLFYRENEVVLEAWNNGSVPENEAPFDSRPNGGMGLQGMDERTRLIGGSLEIVAAYPFTVITRIPVYKQNEVM